MRPLAIFGVILLSRFAAADERVTLPHPKIVLGHILSEDGQWLATTSKDHTVRIWNVAERKLWSQHSTQWMGRPMRFHGEGDRQSLSIRECRMVKLPAFDNRLVAGDQLLRVNLSTREEWPRTFGAGAGCYLEAVSPDGRWVVTMRNNDKREPVGFDVWEVATAKKQCELADSARGSHCAFSHDGSQFAAVINWAQGLFERPTARLASWQTASWTDPAAVQNPTLPIPSFNGETYVADIRQIKQIEFSRDGRWLAAGGVSQGHREEAPDIARFFDLKTGEQRLTKQQARCLGERVSDLHFSDDGRYLLASCRERSTTMIHDHCPKLAVWDTATGDAVLQLKGGGYLSPRISPDGRYLVAIVRSKSDTLTIWSLSKKEAVKTYPVADLSEFFEFGKPPGYGLEFAWPDTALSFTPDGGWLIVTAPLLRGDDPKQVDFASLIEVGTWEKE